MCMQAPVTSLVGGLAYSNVALPKIIADVSVKFEAAATLGNWMLLKNDLSKALFTWSRQV